MASLNCVGFADPCSAGAGKPAGLKVRARAGDRLALQAPRARLYLFRGGRRYVLIQELRDPADRHGQVEPRDEFPADAMARIMSGFPNRYWNAALAQPDAKRQPRQSAANNCDGFQRRHFSSIVQR